MAGCVALIVAAGRGQRFGGEVPKQYRLLAGHPLLRHCARAFGDHPRVELSTFSGDILVTEGDAGVIDVMLDGSPDRFVFLVAPFVRDVAGFVAAFSLPVLKSQLR